MTEHDTLPLPDYDHLPVEGLTSRIRTLDAQGLETVLEYERAHANRVQVVTIMEDRLQSLREGVQPSGGHPVDVGDRTPGPSSAPGRPEPGCAR